MNQPRSVTLEEQPNFYRLRIIDNTMVVSFPRPRHVVSWAILNGGMRTHAAHVINHQVDVHARSDDPKKTLRQAASKVGIKGVFVGMMTGVDVRQCSIAKGVHEDLQAHAIATVGCGNLATVGETGTYVEGQSQNAVPGTINLILLVNYHFTHEAMLEAMAIATEAKVRAMYEFDLRSMATGQPATGTGTDCVAVASGHDRRYVFCGKHTKWGELVGRASLESIRGALRRACTSEKTKQGAQHSK
jgi:adenosylcobinamide amidohydrolase